MTSGNIDAIGIRNNPIQKTGEVKTIVSIPVKIAPTGSTGQTLLHMEFLFEFIINLAEKKVSPINNNENEP